jgi:hypothetical protein
MIKSLKMKKIFLSIIATAIMSGFSVYANKSKKVKSKKQVKTECCEKKHCKKTAKCDKTTCAPLPGCKHS